MSLWLGGALAATVIFAGCSSDSDGQASTSPSPATSQSVSPAASVSSATPEVVFPPPTTAPTPLVPIKQVPPLPVFGDAHDLGTVLSVSAETMASGHYLLRIDRKAYVHCVPVAGDTTCLDGYQIEDVEEGTREYLLSPTAKITLSVRDSPEEYVTGDLKALRERIAANPNNLVMLQLDADGDVVAVGTPWLP